MAKRGKDKSKRLDSAAIPPGESTTPEGHQNQIAGLYARIEQIERGMAPMHLGLPGHGYPAQYNMPQYANYLGEVILIHVRLATG